MERDRVRIGVIGCGVIGRFHMRGAAEHRRGRLVAVADVRPGAAQAAGTEYGASRVYDSADALLADPEVDGVVLALPTGVRGRLAERAFAAGKHVLVEKPAAMDAAELGRLIAAQGDKLIGACCSSRFRCYPSARAATDAVRTGALGRLRLVRFRGVIAAPAPPAEAPAPWRLSRRLNGGGILVNWGVYDLDYLLGILDWSLQPRIALAQAFPVPEVYFRGHVDPTSDAEAHIVGLVICDDGAALSIERGEFLTSTTDNAWEIIGDRGGLRLNMLYGTKAQLLCDATPDRGTIVREIWSGTEDAGEVHVGPVRDFIDAIADSRPPLTSLRQAMVVQRIIDAMYASAEAGRAVEVAG